MKRTPVLLCLVFLLTATTFSCRKSQEIVAIGEKEIDRKALDLFLVGLMDSTKMPGLSIAIINNGKIVYHKFFGVKNTETGERISDETLFESASLSKPLFAYFVMKEVEEGRFNLDTPLYKYLPYPDIAYDDRYKMITGRMVLSHTSGFPNWRNGSLKIDFLPGTRYQYSGEGFQYLKNVIAHIRNTDDVGLDRIFQEEVAEQIGAWHLRYTWNGYQALHKATGHLNNQPTDKNSQGDPTLFGAAYSLHTEAYNYALFLMAMMEKKGLTKETFNEMLKPQIVFSDEVSAETELWGWSLGFAIDSTSQGVKYIHSGNNGDFQAYAQFYRDTKNGFVFFTNSDVLGKTEFGEKLAEFLGEK